jgi:hypothetical protein
MAPWKAPKMTGESSSQNIDVLSDTSPRSIDTVKSWTQISNILQYELVNCPDDSSDNEKEDLATKYKIVAQSELHKIAARPRLLPYNDMIGWALEHVDIPTRTIFNSQKITVGSFRPEHLQVMYKLSPEPNFIYNASFLATLTRRNVTNMEKTFPT